jgi:ribosome-binding factor A
MLKPFNPFTGNAKNWGRYEFSLFLRIDEMAAKFNKYFMESTRLQKVSRLIQKELGSYFQRESKAICAGKMVSVTTVRVSSDLSVAKVYLSIFPSDKSKETLTTIKTHTKTVRHFLGQQVHNQMRIVPELEFFIDDSLDYIEKIESILKK